MESLYAAEQNHKFHHYLTKKSILDNIEIPPRKLLRRRSDMFMDSPTSENTQFQKFLPFNSVDDDDDDDPYSSDQFRMYEFKIRRCARSRSHDWTDCPFAHPGEKARRRDPRKYHYSGTVCSEFRKGSCNRGDNCEFAHGVFENWLHPDRYRTEACKDGKNCKRKICFFAHTPRQLRLLNCDEIASSPRNSVNPMEKKNRNLKNCCVYCHSVSDSPTSTLMMGMSHLSPPMSPAASLSPPHSPAKTHHQFPSISRYSDRYKDALAELVSSLEAMNMSNEANSSSGANYDYVNFNNNYDDNGQQFILSPSTPSPVSSTSSRTKFYRGEFPASGSRRFMEENNNISSKYNNSSAAANYDYVNLNNNCDDINQQFILSPSTPRTHFYSPGSGNRSFVGENNNNNNNGNGLGEPDIGWVNDLLT